MIGKLRGRRKPLSQHSLHSLFCDCNGCMRKELEYSKKMFKQVKRSKRRATK